MIVLPKLKKRSFITTITFLCYAAAFGATPVILPNELRPCRVQVNDHGLFSFEFTTNASNFLMYDRGDAMANEKALREALPALYQSFKLK